MNKNRVVELRVLRVLGIFGMTFGLSFSAQALDAKLSLEMLSGWNSNAIQSEQSQAGSYFSVDPKVELEQNLGDDLILFGGLEAGFRDYYVGNAQDIAGDAKLKLDLGGLYYLSESLELGADLSLLGQEKLTRREAGAFVPAVERFMNPAARLYGGKYGDEWGVELGVAGKTLRYSTFHFDLRNAAYKNDYDEAAADLKVEHYLTSDLTLKWTSRLSNRQHLSRMAEFTDGAPVVSGTGHPSLRIVSHRHAIESELKSGRWDLLTEISAQFDNDTIFGARDSETFEAKLGAKFQNLPGLREELEASVSMQNFSSFKANPLGDPQFSDLRQDFVAKVKLGVSFDISDILLGRAQYNFGKSLTNFVGASYMEHGLEGGLALQL